MFRLVRNLESSKLHQIFSLRLSWDGFQNHYTPTFLLETLRESRFEVASIVVAIILFDRSSAMKWSLQQQMVCCAITWHVDLVYTPNALTKNSTSGWKKTLVFILYAAKFINHSNNDGCHFSTIIMTLQIKLYTSRRNESLYKTNGYSEDAITFWIRCGVNRNGVCLCLVVWLLYLSCWKCYIL